MRLHLLCYSVQYLLTVRLPRFFTLHTKCTFLPTKPVIFDGIVVSKYGPVPGVGNSCRKSVKNRLELPKQVPENIPITKQIVFNKCMTNSIFFGSLSSELFAPTLRLLLLLLWNIYIDFFVFSTMIHNLRILVQISASLSAANTLFLSHPNSNENTLW